MPKPIIEVKNLCAGYDGRAVIHGVNLTIYENDFFGIIGPNGGGKTTLIKCILGLLKPISGQIDYLQENVADKTELSVGYLPHYKSIDRKLPLVAE